MLNKMRNSADSALMKTFLGVLALSFVGWGVGDFVSGGYNSTAIRVDDEKISIQDIVKKYNTALQNVQQRFGSEISPDMARQLGVTQNVISSIVQESVVDQMGDNLNLRISDAQLKEMITANTAFHNNDGEFNDAIYKNALRNAGMTPEGYEQALRDRAVRSTMIDLFSAPFENEEVLEQHLAFASERMDLRTLEITRDNIDKPAAPTQEEIQAYFETNKHNFNAPEMRDITVLTLRLNDLMESVEVSDEEAQAIYDEDKASFMAEEMREVSHILVENEETALEISQKLKDGEDFAKLASEYSIDAFSKVKGGSMGKMSANDMEADFSQAAFSLQKGEVSAPVKTSFGWHIILVSSISEPKQLSFEDVKEQIISDLKAERAENAYYNKLERLEDAVAGGTSLDVIAEELSLKTQTYKNVNFETASMPEAELILPEAFELNEGEVSNSLELNGEMGQMHVMVTNISPAHPLTLEESKANIVKAITNQKTTEALIAQANELLQARKDGAELKRIARNHGLKPHFKTFKNVSMQGENAAPWMNGRLMNALVKLNPNQIVPNLVPTQEGFAIVELVKRYNEEVEGNVEEQFKQSVGLEMNKDLQTQFIQELINDAEIEQNDTLLRSTLGAAYAAPLPTN